MMTAESPTKLRSMTTPISLGVEIEVCASASNKVHKSNQERDSVAPKIKPSKRPPDLGKGKLAKSARSQREATESGRVADFAAP